MRGVGRIYRETRSRASTKKKIKFINVTVDSSLLVRRKFAAGSHHLLTQDSLHRAGPVSRNNVSYTTATYCPADHVPD